MENKPDINNSSQSTAENSFLVDTHCHLDMAAYAADIDTVLKVASSNGIRNIISIGIDLPSSMKCIELAQKYNQIVATIGIHPHDIDDVCDADYFTLKKMYEDHQQYIVGFGEIGLDYHKKFSDPAKQRYHFRKQLDLAHELKLPVVVHNRSADDDIYEILRQAKPLDNGGVMHCFSGNYLYARKIIDLGMHISVPGVVTFKNSSALQEVAKRIPLTSMLVETDGPFLAPSPFRGKRNEPAYLLYTAKKIAELRQIDITAVAQQTSANAQRLFSLTYKESENDKK